MTTDWLRKGFAREMLRRSAASLPNASSARNRSESTVAPCRASGLSVAMRAKLNGSDTKPHAPTREASACQSGHPRSSRLYRMGILDFQQRKSERLAEQGF